MTKANGWNPPDPMWGVDPDSSMDPPEERIRLTESTLKLAQESDLYHELDGLVQGMIAEGLKPRQIKRIILKAYGNNPAVGEYLKSLLD